MAKIRTEATKLDSSTTNFDTIAFELDTIAVQVLYSDGLYIFNCAEIIRDTNYSFQIRIYGIDESTKYYYGNYPSMKYSDLHMMHEVFVKDDEVLFEWWPSSVRACFPIPINSETGLFYDYQIILSHKQLISLENLTQEKIKTGYNKK